MDKIKRFIDIQVPVSTCSLRCEYCFITQHHLFDSALPKFSYSAETFRQALSKERWGGTCLINICGDGETLLPPQMTEFIKVLLEEGHYLNVVTNGTVTRAFDTICKFPKPLLSHLLIKFSYHYVELKKRNLLDKFFTNVKNVRDAGASISVELTPYDDLIPYIDELKQRCIDEVGASPHVTVARDETKGGVPILTSLSIEDYKKTWGVFNSAMFDFKMSVWEKKVHDYCYAGSWGYFLEMQNGCLRQCCFACRTQDNIFADTSMPIKNMPIGTHCVTPHCINAHAWLTLGHVPEWKTQYTYADMRNRVCVDGSEWLKPEMKAAMCTKLYETYDKNTWIVKSWKNSLNVIEPFIRRVKRYIKKKMHTL